MSQDQDILMKQTEIYWNPIGTVGLEHLMLQESADGIVADGLVLRHHQGNGLRLRYHLRCDADWTPRELRVESLGASTKTLHISADGSGHWFDADGKSIDSLNGCIDVDIMATPFTNTLAIRHLNLSPGMSQTIDMVFVSIPDLQVQRAAQRYTCLSRDGEQSRYMYESLSSGFKAELWVDSARMVRVYEGQWERVAI